MCFTSLTRLLINFGQILACNIDKYLIRAWSMNENYNLIRYICGVKRYLVRSVILYISTVDRVFVHVRGSDKLITINNNW